MNWGIKASKPGADVNVAGNDDLFVNTAYPLLKIKDSGTGTLSVTDGGNDSDTISHNLGFVPKVFVFGQYYSVFGSAKVSDYTKYPVRQQVVGVYETLFTYTIDSSDLVISGAFTDGTSNSGTFDYFYYIFYDEA